MYNTQDRIVFPVLYRNGNYCVKKTAIAALKIGYEVFLNENCIGIADTKKYEKSKTKMERMGIKFL